MAWTSSLWRSWHPALTGGLQLTGEGGVLAQLTKRLLESAFEGEITDHLGYDKYDPAGRGIGNSRNGTRAKTVLTDVGPVQVDVPRDRDASFEPKIVAKRQKRLGGIDEMVISLAAKGLTTGEISAHLAEVYGAEVSRQTISTITDKVVEGMVEWQNRPLDPVYPVIFIDAIHVKIRDGQVANRPIYVALAVTCEGRRDILGLWAGDGGKGAPALRCPAGRDRRALDLPPLPRPARDRAGRRAKTPSPNWMPNSTPRWTLQPAPRQRLFAVCDAYLEFTQAHPGRYRTMFGGLWMPDLNETSLAENGLSALGQASMHMLTDALEDCVNAGCATSTNLAADTVALWLGLHGLAHQRAVAPSFRWPPDVAERLVTALAHLTDKCETRAQT